MTKAERNKRYYDEVYDYNDNKFYKKYIVQRDRIREKYTDLDISSNTPRGAPPKAGFAEYTIKERNRHRKYLKEIGDLLYKKNGWFQKFVWDDISASEQIIQEKKCRRRKNDSKYE